MIDQCRCLLVPNTTLPHAPEIVEASEYCSWLLSASKVVVSNPVAPTLLQWHSIRVAMVLSYVLKQEQSAARSAAAIATVGSSAFPTGGSQSRMAPSSCITTPSTVSRRPPQVVGDRNAFLTQPLRKCIPICNEPLQRCTCLQ